MENQSNNNIEGTDISDEQQIKSKQADNGIVLKPNDSTVAQTEEAQPTHTTNPPKDPKRVFVSFSKMISQLEAHKEEHGHLDVKRSEDKSLAKFCCNIRSARNGTGNMKYEADHTTHSHAGHHRL